MNKTHECPSCKGSGKLEIRGEIRGQLDAPVTITEINCISCEGLGRISQEQLEYLEWEANQWCKCEVHVYDMYLQGDVVFFDDGEHLDCYKHHWRHEECGKIVQIG
jgi:hypothetical protein